MQEDLNLRVTNFSSLAQRGYLDPNNFIGEFVSKPTILNLGGLVRNDKVQKNEIVLKDIQAIYVVERRK